MTRIGMHTSTVQHVVEIRSSWTILDGFAYPGLSPHVMPRPTRSIPRRITRLARGVDEARAEIARRIRAKAKR